MKCICVIVLTLLSAVCYAQAGRLLINGKDTIFITDPVLSRPDVIKIGEETYAIPDRRTGKNQIYRYVDQMPEARYDVNAYLARHLALGKQTDKKIVVQFNIASDGSIEHVRLSTPVDPKSDSIITAVFSNMPKWQPAMLNGKAIAIPYTLPVNIHYK